MIGVRYMSAGIPACTISRTAANGVEIAVSPSEAPNVKTPTSRRLIGRNHNVACSGAPTISMIEKRTISERPRLTRPESTIDNVKIDGGTRTRFMSGPFHATLAIAFTAVCAKKFHATYAERKYVS